MKHIDRLRRDTLVILCAVYVAVRVFVTLGVPADPRLMAAIAYYGAQDLPPVVCAATFPAVESEKYYTAQYAVIPSIMVLPDQPCDMHLTLMP